MWSVFIQHGFIPKTIHTTEMRVDDSTETLESPLRRTAWDDLGHTLKEANAATNGERDTHRVPGPQADRVTTARHSINLTIATILERESVKYENSSLQDIKQWAISFVSSLRGIKNTPAEAMMRIHVSQHRRWGDDDDGMHSSCDLGIQVENCEWDLCIWFLLSCSRERRRSFACS